MIYIFLYCFILFDKSIVAVRKQSLAMIHERDNTAVGVGWSNTGIGLLVAIKYTVKSRPKTSSLELEHCSKSAKIIPPAGIVAYLLS